MYRIDYVDMQHKPKVRIFKTRRQADAKVKELIDAGLMVVCTNWIHVDSKQIINIVKLNKAG